LVRLADLGAFIGGLATGASSALGAVKLILLRPLEKKVEQNEEALEDVETTAESAHTKAESNEYILLGDDEDPNYSGVAQDVADMKETVEHVEEILEEVRDE
jgi:hypothetical protein